MQGWIALHRCITDKAIWENSTPEQKTILITLLLMANHKEKQWEWKGQKFEAKPGQFVASLESIKKKAGKGISIKNVRTALERFEKLEFLANESTKTGRLITIVNWGLYQNVNGEDGKDTGKEVAKRWQRGGKEVAPNNNVIMKQGNNETSSSKDPSSEQGPDGEDEKPSEPGYRKDTPPFRAANYLRKAILSNNPRARVPTDKEEDSLMQKWAQEMDRLNRLGPPGGSKGYTWDEVKKIIDFCMDDSFWQSNILSPAKLREKVVILENKMKERAKDGNIGGKGKKDSRPGFRPSQHDWSSEPDRI